MSTQVELGTVFKGSKSGKIVQAKGATRELHPQQVVIDIAYSGLCGTDLHFRKADMVLGHEGVGVISQVGSDVKVLKVGDQIEAKFVGMDRKGRTLQLSIKAKDNAEQQEALQSLRADTTKEGSGTPGAKAGGDSSSDESGMPLWPFIVAAIVLFGGGLAFALRTPRKKK